MLSNGNSALWRLSSCMAGVLLAIVFSYCTSSTFDEFNRDLWGVINIFAGAVLYEIIYIGFIRI